MNGDTKFIISIIIATVVVIGGGAYLASKTPAKNDKGQTVVSDANKEHLVRDDSPVLGPNDAKVTVVEFGDFQCPACGQAYTPLKQVKGLYQDKSVRFVFRQFPLRQLHENAQLAAEASLAAQAQGKFWEMHDIMYENQTSLTRPDLEKYAQQIGLDMDAFRTALDEHTYADTVNRDYSDGAALGVQGTPTIFINGTQYTGAYDPAQFSAVIDSELNK